MTLLNNSNILHPLLEVLNHENGAIGFLAPPLDQDLWRFMSLGKFLALLEQRSLYFARSDCLGDNFEGTMPQPMTELWNQRQASFLKSIEKQLGEFPSNIKDSSLWSSHRRRFFVSCWHMSKYESLAMWQLYGSLQEAVAIRTTVAALHKNVHFDRGVRYIGKVMYFDFHDNSPALSTIPSPVSPFFMKRNVFEHEKEARVVLKTALHPDDLPVGMNPFGLSVPVNLEEVILQVVVAPNAPDWLVEAVRGLLLRYGLNRVTASRSTISLHPVMPE